MMFVFIDSDDVHRRCNSHANGQGGTYPRARPARCLFSLRAYARWASRAFNVEEQKKPEVYTYNSRSDFEAPLISSDHKARQVSPTSRQLPIGCVERDPIDVACLKA